MGVSDDEGVRSVEGSGIAFYVPHVVLHRSQTPVGRRGGGGLKRLELLLEGGGGRGEGG